MTHVRNMNIWIVAAFVFLILACSSDGGRDDEQLTPPTVESMGRRPTPTAVLPTSTTKPTSTVAATVTQSADTAPQSGYVVTSSPVESMRLHGCALSTVDEGRRLFGTAPAPTPKPDDDGNVDPRTSEPIALYVKGILSITANLTELARQYDEISQIDLGQNQMSSVVTNMSKRLSTLCDGVTSLERPSTTFLSKLLVSDVMLSYSSAVSGLGRLIAQPDSLDQQEVERLFAFAGSLLATLDREIQALNLNYETGEETYRFNNRLGGGFLLSTPSDWILVSKVGSVTVIPPATKDPTLGRFVFPVDWPGSNAVRIRFIQTAEDSDFNQLVATYSTVGKAFGSVGDITSKSVGDRIWADVEVTDQPEDWNYRLRIELGERFVFLIESLCLENSGECELEINNILESFTLVD